MKRFVSAFLLAGGLLVAGGGANAAATVTFTETGGNVVVTFLGSINTSALTSAGPDAFAAAIAPSGAFVNIGDLTGSPCSAYTGLIGPGNWGVGGITPTSSASGDKVGIFGSATRICLPLGYTGGSLSGTSTYSGATLASLNLTVNTYTYSWGSGATADSINLYIGTTPPAAVPSLSEWTQLLLVGLMLMMLIGWHFHRERSY